MVDITPLYELVQLVTDFLPVILIIAIVIFFISLLFMMLPSKHQGGNLRIDKKIKFLVPLLFILSIMMASPAAGAPGITYDATPINATLMTVKLTGLTAGLEYTIFASSNTEAFTNITLIANSATEFVPLPVLDELDGYYLNLGLTTAGVVAAGTASVWVAPRDAGELLPIDAFFDLMVPIILIVIVVGVVVGFVVGVGRKSRGD